MVMHTVQGERSFVKVDGARAADLLHTLAALQSPARRDLAHMAGRGAPKPRKRIFSKVSYWEFLIPGGKPLRIDSGSGGSPLPIAFSSAPGRRRSGDAVSFTAQGGKDYEVDIYTNDGVCTVMVHEVKTLAHGIERVPVALD